MPKLPECQTCQFNARSRYITCAIHPNGPKSDRCLDYRPSPASESWAPTGYSWYNGELIASTDRLTERDRLELLESHPLFTGRCPQCDREFKETHSVHWECDRAGWWERAFRRCDRTGLRQDRLSKNLEGRLLGEIRE